MMIYAAVVYLPVKIFYRITKRETPSLISFINIYFLLVFLYSFFFLVHIPYGPNLGVFDFLREVGLMSYRY